LLGHGTSAAFSFSAALFAVAGACLCLVVYRRLIGV
jgi:hypothetical protein